MTQTNNTYTFECYSIKRKLIYYLIPIWVVVWIVGGIKYLYPLLSYYASGRPVITAIIVFLWLSEVFFALYIWFWNTYGVETFFISKKNLSIKRSVFNFGPRWTFALEKIKSPRLFDPQERPEHYSYHLAKWFIAGGKIVFDYDQKAEMFGIDLTRDEAIELIEKIDEFKAQ